MQNFLIIIRPIYLFISIPLIISFTVDLKGQSLNETVYLALKNNKTIKNQKILLDNSLQNLNIQAGKKLPSLALRGTGARTTNFVENSNSDSYSISLESSYPLFDFGKLEADRKAVEILNSVAKLKFSSFKNDLILKIIEVHLELYKASKLVDLYSNSLEVRKQQFEAVDSRFELGEATKSDLLRAKASISGAEAQLQLGEGNLEKFKESYLFYVGKLSDEVSLPEKAIKIPKLLNKLIEVALKNDRKLLYLKLEEESAREKLKSSEKSILPNLNLSGSLSYGDSPTAGTNRSSGTVALTSSLTLYSGGQKKAQVQIAANNLLSKSVEISIRRNEIIQIVKTKSIELRVANSSVLAKKSEVDALKGLYESVFEEWKLGSKTSLDSDQAYQNLLNAEIDLLTASVNVILAEYSLLKEIGTLERNL